VDNNTENKKRIFVFSNQKGGVGKTTTAISVSSLLAKNGFKTLLIDIDPQGNATSGIGIDKRNQEKTIYQCLHDSITPDEAIVETEFENLYLIPANNSLAGAELELVNTDRREFVLSKILQEMKTKFDFIMIDCPPSLGLLTINALVASEKLLIPLQCEYYSLEALGDLMGTFSLVKSKLNPRLEIGGVILTMADFRAKSTLQAIEEVKSYFGDAVFKAVVPRSIRVSEAPSHGKPIVHYDPLSKGSKAYQEIVDELLVKEGLRSDLPDEKIDSLETMATENLNVTNETINLEGVKEI
jgi:chromosome partitioning protein